MVSQAFYLRPMMPQDAQAIARIGFSAWESNIIDDAWRADAVRRRVTAQLRRFAADPACHVLVAMHATGIAGWGAVDSRTHPGDPKAAQNYVSDLWVDQLWQGQGAGTLLLLSLLDNIRRNGCPTALIETGVQNIAALRLYRRHGFEEIWRGDDFSENVGLIMEKVLLEKSLI